MPRIPSSQKKEVRRNILESAARHFAQHGLSGANINTISVDAGYARGTVYNYFPSKEALFAEVLRLGSDETIRQYRARGVQGDTRAHLVAILEEDTALVREHEAFMRVLVQEFVNPQPKTRDAVLAAVAPLDDEVTAILERGQAAGEVRRTRTAAELAKVLLGQLTMAYVQNWSSGGAWPPWDEIPTCCVELFLDGAGDSSG